MTESTGFNMENYGRMEDGLDEVVDFDRSPSPYPTPTPSYSIFPISLSSARMPINPPTES